MDGRSARNNPRGVEASEGDDIERHDRLQPERVSGGEHEIAQNHQRRERAKRGISEEQRHHHQNERGDDGNGHRQRSCRQRALALGFMRPVCRYIEQIIHQIHA